MGFNKLVVDRQVHGPHRAGVIADRHHQAVGAGRHVQTQDQVIGRYHGVLIQSVHVGIENFFERAQSAVSLDFRPGVEVAGRSALPAKTTTLVVNMQRTEPLPARSKRCILATRIQLDRDRKWRGRKG